MHAEEKKTIMENKNILTDEKLSTISGGRLINIDQLNAFIKERKEAGDNLGQIIRVVVVQPNYQKYTDDVDIFGLMEYTTNYYNSLPGGQGAFVDGEIIDY